jgi:transcriptional regulator with XRE-family HTH domain
MGRHPSRRHASPDEAPVGRRIRARRRALGLTQANLAGSAYTKSFISQLEGGYADPSLDTLRFLGRRLHLGLSAMAGDAADQRLSVLAGLLDWAQEAMRGQRTDLARRAIELAREIAAEARSDFYAAEAVLLLADLELDGGNLERVQAALNEMAQMAVATGSRTSTRTALTQGRLALRRGDPASAAAAFRRALGHVRKAPRHPDLVVRAMIGIAVASIPLGEFRQARRRLESAMALAVRHGLEAWHGRALIVLAEVSRIEGRAEEADQQSAAAGRALADTGDRVAQAEAAKPAGERALDRLV